MSIVEEVIHYENWLREQCRVDEAGLARKRKRLAKDPLSFLRASCFHFAKQFPIDEAELMTAPSVPSVGDAHIENFGTWRDAEGRLVWGINDFDEAADLPYTVDLVRLATSALLADGIELKPRERVAAILAGYRDGLARPGPFFVDDQASWMLRLLSAKEPKPGAFTDKLNEAELLDGATKGEPPADVVLALVERLPAGTVDIEFRSWQRGGGGLGRPRYLAIGQWQGGRVVREAKAIVPSAWYRIDGSREPGDNFVRLALGRYRSPDPFLGQQSHFVIRRLAADSDKIDLSEEDAQAFGSDLFTAMGRDLASVHLGGEPRADAIRAHLPPPSGDGWLMDSATRCAKAALADHAAWKEYLGRN